MTVNSIAVVHWLANCHSLINGLIKSSKHLCRVYILCLLIHVELNGWCALYQPIIMDVPRICIKCKFSVHSKAR